MAKRNQYNRTNFAQLPPMQWGQPTTFNKFTLNSSAYLTVPTQQPGLSPPTYPADFPGPPAAITMANPLTWPVDGLAPTGAIGNGARAMQMFFLTGVVTADASFFLIEILNAQVTSQSIIFLELACNAGNGVFGNIRTQSAGSVIFQISSNGTDSAGALIALSYLILNPT